MKVGNLKRCPKCKHLKPMRTFTTPAGNVRCRCKPCRAVDAHLMYERNKDKWREQRAETVKRWRLANPERWAAIQKKSKERRKGVLVHDR